jgi:hypothetical protein
MKAQNAKVKSQNRRAKSKSYALGVVALAFDFYLLTFARP